MSMPCPQQCPKNVMYACIFSSNFKTGQITDDDFSLDQKCLNYDAILTQNLEEI